ncbi:MAG TPA: hypothetical protein VNU49_10410 [Opitutaceae bacterium]|jgi:hypothetical protein|nr:hypothetical protein [Opitutaceae bacterium]
MEPADMTPLSPEDARLEKLFSQDLDAALPDAGFSARVLEALPPPQSDQSIRWGQITALAAGALAGLSIALWQGASWSDLTSIIAQLEQATFQISDQLTDTGLILALAIVAGLLAIEFPSDDQTEERL